MRTVCIALRSITLRKSGNALFDYALVQTKWIRKDEFCLAGRVFFFASDFGETE